MPKGGARKGAGRKPKPLAEKIRNGNPGHRPLTRVEFFDDSYDPTEPPSYLDDFIRYKPKTDEKPSNIYREIIKFLEPTGCMYLVPRELITDYALARYNLLEAQAEAKDFPQVGRDKKDAPIEISQFQEMVLKHQKNANTLRDAIWDIVRQNSTQEIDAGDNDLLKTMFTGRIRKPPANPTKKPKKE